MYYLLSMANFPHFDSANWITLVASFSAFFFSLLGYLQKRTDIKQALRKQLTEALKQLVDMNMEEVRYRAANEEERREKYPGNFMGVMNDQRRFLVRQAASVADKLGDEVSTYERMIIAWGFDSTDYVEDAERFFKSAITANRTSIDLGLAQRSYGRFLLRQGEVDRGNAEFQRAIETLRQEDERTNYYRGETYIRWADSTFDELGDSPRAKALLAKAVEQMQKLRSQKRRMREVERIERRIKEISR